MRIGLLGELEVRDDDNDVVVVTGAKLCALLAMLALSVGRVVPADLLAEALWGDDPPTGVRNSLQGLVSKLRRALGSSELVAMRGGGYALELSDESIDVNRYEELVAEGQDVAVNDPERAVALFARADSLWRGHALADFTYEEFAGPSIGRLSEMRLAATEQRIDIELHLCRHPAVIVELETLVAAHPLRERLRGLLMIALYRSGRQAEALRTMQEARRLLAEELGLEPGPELRRLEAAILVQDASLDASEVVARGLNEFTSHSTIPESLSPLIGRDEELRDLSHLVAEHRLVTLVGPGGVGKTRLALEVARAESESLEYGGCLVELARVGAASSVRAAIASALDVPDSSRLAESIGNRQLLVLLDNCEHVIATAADVAEDLLQRCPNLRIVATSREGLRVDGETVWMVPPLAAAGATRLFVTRAQATGVPVDESEEAITVITDICGRLDGMPLAIELAAARTRAFSVQQISVRLNDRFRLLTGGSRTALPRQQTLRAVVDWSYELLFEEEQRVFEQLSVFPGGCNLDTAIEICADETLNAEDLEDIIHALVDKSLVVTIRSGDGLRFTQLQTLAHYGQEKLAERGDAERIRTAMAAHYATLCAKSAAAFNGEHQRSWLLSIDEERDNLRGAIEWAVANDDAETALGIAGGVSWTHWLGGTVTEGKRWLDDAFGCRGEASEGTRALALMGRGLINFLAGASSNSDSDLSTALSIFRERHDVSAMAVTYSFYAERPHVWGDVDEARRRRLEVLAFYVGLPDSVYSSALRSYSKAQLGILDGDLVAAELWYRESEVGFVKHDRPVMRSMCLGILADFDERSGRYGLAIKELEEAIAIIDSLGLRSFNGSLLSRLAWVQLKNGNVAQAESMNRRALDVGHRLRSGPVLFLALTGSAVLHRHHGRSSEAIATANEALGIYRMRGPRRFGNRIDPESEIAAAAAACCAVLAVVAGDVGDHVRCAQLLGHADRLRREARSPVPEFQRVDIEQAHEGATVELGPDACAAAFEQGRTLDLDELVAFGHLDVESTGYLHVRRHEGGMELRSYPR